MNPQNSRVEKELVNIRGKFSAADKKGGLNSYHKKKCVRGRPVTAER